MIRLRTLGQIDLTAADGGDADTLVAQPKRFALLCYLAIPKPGTMLRRDTLLGVFWPKGDSEHTRTALRQALAHIRKALGHDVIVKRGAEEVGLDPDLFWCDVAAYEQALDACKWSEAIDLYRGELLKGFYVSHAPEFERWLDGERARLAGRYAAALEELANAAAAAGKTRAAVEWWQSLVLHDPYDSRLAMGLMEALDRAGDPGNALLHARKHTELLREELDVGPSAEFEALVGQMRLSNSASVSSVAPLKETGGKRHADADTRQSKQPLIGAVPPPAPARLGAEMLRWRYTLPSVVIILFGALFGNWLWNPGEAPSTPNRPTVALFRLQNLGAPDDSVFALGVTDALITRLSKISELRITFGNTDFSNAGLTREEIDLVFGASHYLTGTFQREPGRDSSRAVRISVQLMQVSDGICLWAEEYEVELADLFQMYSDIGGQIARALNVTLLDEERAALVERPSQNSRAYEHYLVGSAYFEAGFPLRWELRNAVEQFEMAIEADTEFAIAYAWLSLAHGGLFNGGLDRSDGRLEQQKAAADAALRLDPNLPEGHLALGLYHFWIHSDYERALGELELAREGLASDYWYLYWKAAIDSRTGNLREAAVEFGMASDLRPLAWSPALNAAQTYRVLRRYEEAHHFLDRYVANAPSRPYPYLRKALAYLEESGDAVRAREVLHSGPEHLSYDVMIAEAARDYCMPGWFRLLRVLCGDCSEAIELMQLKSPREHWHFYLGKALLYGRAGNHHLETTFYDSAAVILENMIEVRYDHAHYHADLALIYAARGRNSEAIQKARLAVSLSPLSGDFWYGSSPIRKLAEVYAMAGEADSAVVQLEGLLSAFAAGEESGHYVNPRASVPLMRIDPIWDPIRDHPAFQALLKEYDPLR